jgi:hypothetical protein
LAQFLAAPAAVQEQFWAAIRRRVEWEHLYSRWREVMRDEDAVAPIALRRKEPRRVRWGEPWRRRVEKYRRWAERGRKQDPDFDRDMAFLLSIDATDFVDRLLPEVERRGSMIVCPFHEERTPSCSLRGTTFHCFGCGQRGSIYDFAGELWDMARHGRQFVEIHKRLAEMFR